MHRNAGAGQDAARARGLLDADPLVHQVQKPVRGSLESARDADVPGTRHESVRAGSAKACSKRILVNQLKLESRAISA